MIKTLSKSPGLTYLQVFVISMDLSSQWISIKDALFSLVLIYESRALIVVPLVSQASHEDLLLVTRAFQVEKASDVHQALYEDVP